MIKLFAGVVMLSVLVIIHELGHFLVARLFGVGVPVFSVGMGPRLFGVRRGGTDYRISAVPVGGYVQLAGADPFGDSDEDDSVDPAEDFMRKPVWQRLLVMFAGPAFNLLLPIVVFSGVFMAGQTYRDSLVGRVHHGSPADVVGLSSGDRIVSVNGRSVDTWTELTRALQRQRGEAVELGVARGEEQWSVRLPPSSLSYSADGVVDLSDLGLSWLVVSSRVGIDDPASPAARAGIRTGDAVLRVDGEPVHAWTGLMDMLEAETEHRLLVARLRGDQRTEEEIVLRPDSDFLLREGDPWTNRWGLVPAMMFVGGHTADSAARDADVRVEDRIYGVNGQVVHDWNDLLERVRATAPSPREAMAGGCRTPVVEVPEPAPVTLTVIREGELVELHIEPRMHRELVRTMVVHRPLIGISLYPDAFVPGEGVVKRYGLLASVGWASRETVDSVRRTFDVLGQLFTGGRRVDETLGGPIAIFDMAGRSAEQGFSAFAQMVAMISIGLGVVNLLPVPALDGGQILFYAMEGIRGRPLSLVLRERIQMIGVLFLVALILLVSVNDCARIVGR